MKAVAVAVFLIAFVACMVESSKQLRAVPDEGAVSIPGAILNLCGAIIDVTSLVYNAIQGVLNVVLLSVGLVSKILGELPGGFNIGCLLTKVVERILPVIDGCIATVITAAQSTIDKLCTGVTGIVVPVIDTTKCLRSRRPISCIVRAVGKLGVGVAQVVRHLPIILTTLVATLLSCVRGLLPTIVKSLTSIVDDLRTCRKEEIESKTIDPNDE